jgi:MtN3 and saliva related transmembrane protein
MKNQVYLQQKNTRMTTVEIVGFSASLLSILNQFPQALKVYKTKDTHSISLLMYCIVVVCISLWLVYGIMLVDGPLILANALSLIPIVYIFIMKLTNTIKGIDQLSI